MIHMRYWLLRVRIQDENDFHVLSTHTTEGEEFDPDTYVKTNYPSNAQFKRLNELTLEEYVVLKQFQI